MLGTSATAHRVRATRPAAFTASMRTLGLRAIFLIIAIICFVLDAIGLDVNVSLIAVGLAFFAASFLVGDSVIPR